ncbi:GIY-YIG nuclease family protein [Siminovitchia fordii]|uniref:GIY-YIG domain-containing protein n=1 Tax=Siminovitchia fordii TaxID=254759 RepID=A0ABQ4KD26_9BACI|nr:GIY-YIG nuclease family protein [Siminovitchia fordii]GIN23100.1 hypothetical protein J1TS3_42340 [Siminovitchia fordii]
MDISNTQRNEIISFLYDNQISDFAAIYSIRNKMNNKSYIGSTKNLISRWKSHLIDINNKTHHCREFNLVKSRDLEFILLEVVSNIDELVLKEYGYINLFSTNTKNKGYNILSKFQSKRKTNRTNIVSLSTKLKQSSFTLNDVKNIKRLLASGRKISDVALIYNTNYNTIQSIKTCRTWSDVLPELNSILISIEYKDTHKGENNSCSKLTEDDVKEIKHILNTKKSTMTEIAKNYGVSRTLISHIKYGRLWSHVI